MNRRQLLKTITGLGYITLASKDYLFTQTKSKQPHFIGIGNAGSEALIYIYSKGITGKYTSINDRNPPIPGINYIKFIPPNDELITNGDKVIRISRMNNDVVVSEELKRIFESDDRYILLSGLGGFTGTKFTGALSQDLTAKNKDFISICSLPFDFESDPCKLNAPIVVNNLKSKSNFEFFKLESIREQYGNLKMKDAFMLGNEFFYKIYLSQVG